MKVIVAGMPKTGTKTMGAALALLGCEVYDWMENFYYLGDDWLKIKEEGGNISDFRRMYKNVDAVVDSPACMYWEELTEAFPEAKVILTLRDENKWYQSIVRQVESLSNDLIMKCLLAFTPMGWKCLTYRKFALGLLGNRNYWPWSRVTLFNEETMRRMFRKHNDSVLTRAPKDRLLVYRVNEGWEPLCKFLDVEKPKGIPFPHKNKGASVIKELLKENAVMKIAERQLYTSFAMMLLVFAMAIVYFFSFFRIF